MLLLQAEFSGFQKATELSRIQSNTSSWWITRGIRQQPETDSAPSMACTSAANQLGKHPTDARPGVLPIQQHVWARHTMWALKLVCGLAAPPSEVPPWILAAGVALCGVTRSMHSIPILGWKGTTRQLVQCPPPLCRMFGSIAHLSPPSNHEPCHNPRLVCISSIVAQPKARN